MLTLRDCLDYADLAQDEVDTLAQYQHLPPIVAAELACALAQNEDGLNLLRDLFRQCLERACDEGDARRICQAETILKRFEARLANARRYAESRGAGSAAQRALPVNKPPSPSAPVTGPVVC